MSAQLALSVRTAFGLAFDIEKALARKSGFQPARFDLGAGKDLFGMIRLDGFAALLRTGFAERLVVIGGNEGRYKSSTPVLNRAAVIREMLIYDLGILPDQVSSIASHSNTGGNIAAISAEIRREGLSENDCAVVSNHYHIPRVVLDLAAANVSVTTYPAEAFWLIEDENRKNQLIERFEGGPLAERIAEEVQGVAHKIIGTYKPKTDTPVVSLSTESQLLK